jgi:hypothetical protein
VIDILIKSLGQHFIGLWCFRVYGQPRKYAVTLNVGGNYYDTLPKRTRAAALREAWRVLRAALREVA